MSYWAQSVRGIKVSIALHMRNPAPQALSFIRSQNAAQIVQICRLSVSDFAENSVTHHVQDHHLGRTITAVFQDDTMPASGFGSIDQFPTFLQCCTGGHFDGRVLAI